MSFSFVAYSGRANAEIEIENSINPSVKVKKSRMDSPAFRFATFVPLKANPRVAQFSFDLGAG